MKVFRIPVLVAFALALVVGATDARANDYFDPVGTDDRASCTRLEGWVKDGDTTLPTWAHIYKDAPYPNGTLVASVVANVFRSDLPFSDKNHGYSIPTPAAFFTGCPVAVYVHGIDVDTNGNPVPGGNNALLNLTGRTIRCGQPDPSCFRRPGDP